MHRLTRLGSVATALLLPMLVGSCALQSREVVIYTSVDQVYAEPALKRFEAETGITVRAVYDAEAAKTTGLVNRIAAEKERPRADVWWSGEIVQTLKLAEDGLLAEYRSTEATSLPPNLRDAGGRWAGFGGRARVFVRNTGGLAGLKNAPRTPTSLLDLAAPPPDVAGTGGMSNPVFGTASTQAAVLYAVLGPEDAKRYYMAIADGQTRVLEGNGDVRDKVVSGEFEWGLTDTDDALAAIEKGAPVRIVVPDQEVGGLRGAILIPNTVGLVAGGPNPEEGKLLIDYLLAAETEQSLMRDGWIQFPVRGDPDPRVAVGRVRFMPIDWQEAYGMLDRSSTDMREIFLR